MTIYILYEFYDEWDDFSSYEILRYENNKYAGREKGLFFTEPMTDRAFWILQAWKKHNRKLYGIE